MAENLSRKISLTLKIVKSFDWSNLTNVTKDSLGQIAP